MSIKARKSALFAVLWRVIARRSNSSARALVGALLFSALLFVTAELILLPSVQSPMLTVPALHFGIGHLVYGLVLGGLMARSARLIRS